MSEATLFYVAVAKPRSAYCFTILHDPDKDSPIISMDPARCVEKGKRALPGAIGPKNRFQDASEWEVRAARVVLE